MANLWDTYQYYKRETELTIVPTKLKAEQLRDITAEKRNITVEKRDISEYRTAVNA